MTPLREVISLYPFCWSIIFSENRFPLFGIMLKLLRRRRKRLRMLRQGVQIGDHVGAFAVLGDTGKAHRGAGNKARGIGDELVEVVKGPVAALCLHGGREVEACLALPLLLADDAVEVGADAVRSALLERMAG